jgi:hypothetical protein
MGILGVTFGNVTVETNGRNHSNLFFFSFVIFFTQTVGLLERVMTPSQGPYLHRTT